MGYSLDPISNGCYEGTSVLINKFNVTISPNALLLCNEEGKLICLEANRRIGNDIICGVFYIISQDKKMQFFLNCIFLIYRDSALLIHYRSQETASFKHLNRTFEK